MYKPRDTKTAPLFTQPFALYGQLDKNNRWLRLAALVNWAEMENVYMRHFSRFGRPAKDARLVCGLLMIKWLENYSDERAVAELRENPYVQAFCGFPAFSTDEIADSGILYRARQRLGRSEFSFFEDEIADLLRKNDTLRQKFPRGARARPGLAGRCVEWLKLLCNRK
ncbi:MAG: transposase [Elusimicrobiales bacterium]